MPWEKSPVRPLLSTERAHRCLCSTCYFGEEPLRQTEPCFQGEPKLQDVMSDPIVHLVMRRDGLTSETVWAIIRETSARLPEQPEHPVEAA